MLKFRHSLLRFGGALYCALCCTILPANAQELPDLDSIDPDLREKAERLIEVSGAKESVEAIVPTLIRQLSVAQLPPEAAAIVEEEVTAFFDESLDDLINSLIPLYAKYYTEEEIDSLIDFHESPVGRKSRELGPILGRESYALGQQWVQERLPQLQERLRSRFSEAGLIP